MNFLGWRTVAELQSIFKNEALDMDIRTRAHAEILKRNLPMCQVPECGKLAQTTWALVPVCKTCWAALMTEQVQFYHKVIDSDEREFLIGITPYTPWGRQDVV